MAVDILSLAGNMFSAGTAMVLTAVAVTVATLYTVIRQRHLKAAKESGKSSARTKSRATSHQVDPALDHPVVAESMIPGRWPVGENGPSGDNSGAQQVSRNSSRDPLEFCEHIPGEVKRVKARMAQQKVEEQMSQEARAEERRAQREQLSAIFQLLKDQENKYGINTMDDMEEQMKLYTQ